MTNHLGNSVSVIDTKTRKVTATIPVGTDPWSIAITPDAKHVYTANDGGPSPATVSDIATQTATVKVVDGVAGASAVAASPDGAQAYTAGGLGIVTVVDTQTGTLLQTPSGTPAAPQWPNGIKLGAFNTEDIAFSPDGTRAYATTNTDGSLVTIDTQTRAVLGTTKVGDGAIGVAITRDGKRAYVVSDAGVVVVDTSTSAVSPRIAVGSKPQQVAIAPDGKHAYVTGGLGAPTLSVIDTKTGAVTGTIAVGAGPMGVAICSARTAKH